MDMSDCSPDKRNETENHEIKPYEPGTPPSRQIKFEEFIPPQETHLRDYLAVILRRKRAVILFFIAVVATVTVASFTMKPLYKATAVVEIDKKNPNVYAFPEVQPAFTDDQYYQTQYKVLKSRSLAKMVIDSMGLYNSPVFNPGMRQRGSPFLASVKNCFTWLFASRTNDGGPAAGGPAAGGQTAGPKPVDGEYRYLIDKLIGMLDITPVKNSQLVDVSCIAPDPALARQTANAVARTYIAFSMGRQLDASRQAKTLLEHQINALETKLNASEAALNDYAEKNQMLIVDEKDDKENIMIGQLTATSQAMNTSTTSRIKEQALDSVLRRSGGQNPMVLNNPLVLGLERQFNTLDVKYSNLLMIYKPDYPMMKRLKSQMNAIRRRINAESTNIIRSVAAQYNTDLTREQYLSAEIEREKQGILGYQKKNIGYLLLKRNVDANRQIYDSLLQRLKEVSVSATRTQTNIQILDSADLPGVPFSPDKMKNILLASVFGLIGGVGLAFFMEYFDNTFRSTHEIERSTRLPALGMIPMQKLTGPAAGPVKRPLIAYSRSRSPVAEAFRSIGTFILLSSSAKPPKTILVTSPGEKEGKTTICINTAMALTESMTNGIIVDADLRRPKLHHSFDAENSVGLSTFLSGNIGFEEGLIKKTKVKGLDMITSGPIAPNPSELIVSRRMKELLEALYAMYDFVIIDSAPIMGMPDSVYLSSIVDGSVIVIRAGKTTRNILAETKKIFRSIDAKILGVVLNGIKESDLKYNYYSNYYSSYFKEG